MNTNVTFTTGIRNTHGAVSVYNMSCRNRMIVLPFTCLWSSASILALKILFGLPDLCHLFDDLLSFLLFHKWSLRFHGPDAQIKSTWNDFSKQFNFLKCRIAGNSKLALKAYDPALPSVILNGVGSRFFKSRSVMVFIRSERVPLSPHHECNSCQRPIIQLHFWQEFTRVTDWSLKSESMWRLWWRQWTWEGGYSSRNLFVPSR